MTTRFLSCILFSTYVGAVSAEQHCDVTQFPLSAPTERFLDNGDGTVTDSISRLMWMRCGIGQAWQAGDCVGQLKELDWQSAQSAAAHVNDEGTHFYSDWRVPSLRDLAMIIERQCQDPRTNLTVFPRTPSKAFWTTTSRPGDESDDSVYALSFGPDGVQRMAKDALNYTRLVRSSQ